MLGEDARSKFEMQSSGQFGIILGGRMDVLGAFFAIYDSPVLGHGSWAKDPKYLIAQQQALALMDYKVEGIVSPEELEEGLIPSHSHILGAWVDAGILGALFWGWVLFMTVKSLARVHPSTVALLPLASFAAFQLLWDLLFSGYGAEMRIITPYFIVVVMSCLSVTTPALRQALTAKLKSPVKGGSRRRSLNPSAQA
jgi:O-antigen ligase